MVAYNINEDDELLFHKKYEVLIHQYSENGLYYYDTKTKNVTLNIVSINKQDFSKTRNKKHNSYKKFKQ